VPDTFLRPYHILLLALSFLPGGSDLSIYQPRHPTAYDLEG